MTVVVVMQGCWSGAVMWVMVRGVGVFKYVFQYTIAKSSP